jgi:UDP-N-acetylglucosamine 2-epimerase (non-hydrolysing)
MKISIVAGARPNFMKISPIINEITKKSKTGTNISYRLIHTGQHYDDKMSLSFFHQLDIPNPDVNLECGGGSHAHQTASIMIKFEQELIQNPADLVLVVGDVTSTMACAIVAQKLHTKVAHIEAGIRSGDWSMPEEINRLVTDSISNYYFTTTESASQNLLNSGIDSSVVFFVGNTMIDTLLTQMPKFKVPLFFENESLEIGNYFVLTLHRPNNVDDEMGLLQILTEIIHNTHDLPIIFPVHPRTRLQLNKLRLNHAKLIMTDPMGYLEFNYLVKNAKAVITDSGGITEETTLMNVPCMTLRNSTERPETVTVGTNELLGTDPAKIKPALEKLFRGEWKSGGIPDLWDGHTSERIVDIIIKLFPH